MQQPRYTPRTKPFAHQSKAFRLSRERAAFALLMEQGTGKTKVLIDESADLYERKLIDAVLVVAPNEGDIPVNWVEQYAIHFPERLPYTAVRIAANMRAKSRDLFKLLCEPGRKDLGLRVVTINVEAVRKGNPLFLKLLKFMRDFRVFMVVDESDRIKSQSSAQTKGVLKLGANAEYRRIATGTLSPNGPLDVYSQFYFLDPAILGFDSFVAFKAHFCQLLPPQAGIVRFTAQKMAARIRDPQRRDEFAKRMQSIIQIPARDHNGQILYRNQEELNKLIEPHSFRVLKDDCLDLPPKVYEKRYVELTPKQREIYDEVRRNVIAEFVKDQELHTITTSLAIVRLLRLQQVVCNHFSPDPDPDNPKMPPRRIEVAKPGRKGQPPTFTNPRIEAMLGIIAEARPEAKVIVWCRHHPEIREVVEALEASFGHHTVVQLHGLVPDDERAPVRHKFQDPKSGVRFLVGQVRTGIGIDLYAGSVVIYYSNSYSLMERLQSEDRAHRQGQTQKVTIYDIEARNTLDRRIIETLRAKKNISDIIVGDNPKDWI